MLNRDTEIIRTALDVRKSFEDGSVYDSLILRTVYMELRPQAHIDETLRYCRGSFPRGNCGLASAYLKHALHRGRVVDGSYEGLEHSVLLFEPEMVILDITADQFGGPSIYLGPVIPTWSLTWTIDVKQN